MEYEDKSLKSLLRRADKAGSPYVAIMGSEELKKDTILIRDLNRQTQEEIPLSRFMDYFLERSRF
jgi:histidyl-tRNA synthetase